MTQKKLQKGSAWEYVDIDNDGEITDGEIAMAQKMEELEHKRELHNNLDKMQDQQRLICWVSSISSIMLIGLVLSPIIPDTRVEMCTALLSTYIVANLGIVATFMTATAFTRSKENGNGK